MPIPSGVTTRVVRGTYVTSAGVVQQGTVTFRIDQALIATVESWGVVPSPVVAPLDSSGSFSVSLMTSDDEDLFPSGFRYIVQERYQGGYLRTYKIDLPSDADPLDLPSASEYDPGDVGLSVVNSVNGRVGHIVLRAEDYDGLSLDGGTMEGPLILSGDPTDPLGAATKQYADTKLAKSANLSDLTNVNQARFTLGISNVNNTSDVAKPISTATQAALDTKLAKSQNLLDVASIPLARANLNVNNVDNTSDANKPVSTATQTALNTKATRASNLSDLTNFPAARTNIGLGNVDNTSDVNKPISTAQQAGLDLKLTKAQNLADLTNATTARSNLGLGNVNNTSDANKPVSTAQQAALDLKLTIAQNLADLANATTARTNLGLGNVNNTSDVNKPVSTAQQAALDLKLAKASNLSDLASAATSRTNLGLGNVDNTSDANKPVSTATQTALNTKLTAASNLSDVASAATSRTNLGLGNSATLNVGTITGTVAAGDDARFTDQRTPADGSVTNAKLATDAVSTIKIQNLAVTTAKINDGAVTVDKLGDLSVTTAKLALGAVGTTQLADDAVTVDKLADNAVGTTQIIDGGVTSAKILDGSIVDVDINASAAIALSKLATNPLARANHTGTQLSSTISDFSTATTTIVSANALLKASNLSDLASASTARTNLGLGTAATRNIGTTTGTAAAGDDTRFTDQRTPLDNSVTSAKIVDGSIVDVDINASAAIALSKLAVDPLARANHTGTQTSATISDFNTAVRANRLDQMATPTTSVPWGSQKITNLLDPTSAQDAATKNYVDTHTSTASLPWVNVKDYGAIGNNTADDTTAIGNAITALPAGGGIVWFPTGTYKISAALTLRSDIILLGSGVSASIIHQTSTTANCFTGVDVYTITMRDLQLQGPASGSGNGFVITRTSQPNVRYLNFENVYIRQFGNDGIAISNCIVSNFTRVVCENNGRYGFYYYGVTAGAAGTSCNWNACYANTNTGTGFNIYNMAYCSLNGCASEGQPTNFLIDTCQGVTLNGCGSEVMTTGGTGFKINGGSGNCLVACWDYANKGKSFWLTGNAYGINLVGIVENSPVVGTATNSLKVDTGCVGINLHGIVNTTAMSLSAGTTNILNDGANGLTIHGYLYTDGASEFNGSVIFDQTATAYGLFSPTAGLAHTGNLGFYGTAAIAKPTVTGAKGGNVALGNLCTALANLGLITNTTT